MATSAQPEQLGGAAAKTLDTDNPIADMRVKFFLQQVFEQTGRPPRALFREIMRGYWSKRVVTSADYFALRLYDPAFTDAERDRFVGDVGSKRINQALNKTPIHHGVINMKTLLAATLSGYGIAAPETQAVASATQRHPHRSLQTPEALAAFLRSEARYPLFGKPVAMSQSMGVASIDGYDAETDAVMLKGVGPRPVTAFAAEVFETFKTDSYLLQTRVGPHPSLAAAAGPALGTVRVTTLRQGSTVHPLYAVWKIPAADAIADNFWRDGNLIGLVDLESGRVARVQLGKGVSAREVETHPGTGERLLGLALPQWDAALAMVERAALAFPHTPMIGWDVGLGAAGPLIVEGNTNPHHMLFQMAAREGLLSPERQALFDAVEAEVAADLAARKRGRARRRSVLRRRTIGAGLRSVFADR